MRKIVSLLMILVVALAVTGGAWAENYEYLDEMTLEELLDLQTALEAKIASVRTASGSGNTTDMGMWKIKYYVDEFGDYTTEGYVTNKNWIEGKFSNSATTNAKLYVVFLIDDEDVAIKLYEYGKDVVKNGGSSRVTYNVTMKDAAGVRHTLTGYMYSGSDRIFFSAEDEQTILNALSANGNVKFSIVNSKTATDQYIFSVENTSYFVNAYNQLLGEQI